CTLITACPIVYLPYLWLNNSYQKTRTSISNVHLLRFFKPYTANNSAPESCLIVLNIEPQRRKSNVFKETRICVSILYNLKYTKNHKKLNNVPTISFDFKNDDCNY
ncbi:hypothetical protein NPIL_366381, partial [Nephila pilipes]